MAEYQVSEGISDADKRANYITLQVSQYSKDVPEPEFWTIAHTWDSDDLITFSRTQDDSWERKRCVVFGKDVVGEVTDEDAGAYPKALALATDFITTEESAEELCHRILDFFDENLDIKRITILLDESVWLAEIVQLTDSWTGYDDYGMITSIETTIDDRGFRQFVSLDEKCGFVWGWGGGLEVDDADSRANYVTLQIAASVSDADSY